MGTTTQIEWTDATLNTAWGCTKVSEECAKCYMYRLSAVWGRDPFTPEILDFENMKKRLRAIKGKHIFVNSMSDTFHEDFNFLLIKSWFDLFEQYPDHQFQILTKRPERALQYSKKFKIPDNCWIGTSIGVKKTRHRLDTLKKIKAKIRFVSFEPLLEDLGSLKLSNIQWAIVGGESDQKDPRPMQEEWALNILKQCRKYKVPFFYKQSGGKKKNLIDGIKVYGTNYLQGRKYLQMPKVLN